MNSLDAWVLAHPSEAVILWVILSFVVMYIVLLVILRTSWMRSLRTGGGYQPPRVTGTARDVQRHLDKMKNKNAE